MITDSQVGIPRPTGLRRTEQKVRPTLGGLLTEHYVAKIVALLFAGVLIVLIDRELETTLLNDAEFDVRVGDLSRAAAEAPGRRQIVLETEPGVAVRFAQPSQVRVVVKGPEKLRDRFTAKALVASVAIKQSWLKAEGGEIATSRTLDGTSVQFAGVRGVTIKLEEPIKVDIESEVVGSIPLEAVPVGLAPELREYVTFDPPAVRVLGPVSLLHGDAAIRSIAIPIPMGKRSEEFEWPVTALPDEYAKSQIRMASDQKIVARVRFEKAMPLTLPVKEVPLRFYMPPDSEYLVTIIGLPRNTVTVNLTGSPQAVAYWSLHKDELKRGVRAAIDVERLVSKSNPQPGVPTSAFAEVEVFGIPADLKLESVLPPQVDVSVTKRDS